MYLQCQQKEFLSYYHQLNQNIEKILELHQVKFWTKTNSKCPELWSQQFKWFQNDCSFKLISLGDHSKILSFQVRNNPWVGIKGWSHFKTEIWLYDQLINFLKAVDWEEGFIKWCMSQAPFESASSALNLLLIL